MLRQDVNQYWDNMYEQNKQYIMANIIPHMCKVDDLVILHNLEDVIYMIAEEEYPHHWEFAKD